MLAAANARRMRIVTYNVNGLKARIVPYRSLHGFLNALDADILCFQETKVSRQELTADIAIAEGYEAFFSCTRTSNKGKIGYSGVATFCRTQSITACTSCILPVAADEGFTGLLHSSKCGEIEGGDARVGCYDRVLNIDSFSREELLQLDSEGRCVVTDHGSFVLFNIYGPCVQPGDSKRLEFKLNFFRVLQCRWESLLEKGKRVIVVGDLNIAPYPIDSCDPGPEFDSNLCRKWLRSLLNTEGGPFTDAFRAIHGQRKDAYTCWSQNTGAEEFNFGTRIDLILAAGPCLHSKDDLAQKTSDIHHQFAKCHVENCDIMVKFKRFKEDTLPRWAGGRSLKLEGSDHAPVILHMKDLPAIEPHDTPSLAVRYLPYLCWRQQNIDILLQKRTVSSNGNELNQNLCHRVYSESEVFSPTGKLSNDTEQDVNKSHNLHIGKKTMGFQGFSIHGNANGTISGSDKQNWELVRSVSCSAKSTVQKTKAPPKFKRKNVQKPCQTSLKAFFASNLDHRVFSQNECIPQFSELETSSETCYTHSEAISSTSSDRQEIEGLSNNQWNFISCETSNLQENSASMKEARNSFNCTDGFRQRNEQKKDRNLDDESFSFESDVKQDKAQMEWRRIQDLMVRCIPMCKGHGEPCVARIVKKSGPNVGRGFYVCARAKGPVSNPEARCDHFEWASAKWRK